MGKVNKPSTQEKDTNDEESENEEGEADDVGISFWIVIDWPDYGLNAI